MARIAGVLLPDQKKLPYALTAIFGVGLTTAARVVEALNLDATRRAKTLTDDEVAQITDYMEKNQIIIEGDLKRRVSLNIKRLKDIKSYRGDRHAKNLPLRGQRTRSNSRTVRGNVRRTQATGKKVVDKT